MRSFACLVLLTSAVVASGPGGAPEGDPGPAAQKPFPDFGFLPAPERYGGKVFRLSQNYPAKPPDAAKVPAFFKTEFEKDWKKYLMQVRDYCFEGNLEADWRVERNTVRHWYHAPWQHYGPNGREGIHGLTKEAPVQPRQLAATQKDRGQTYAVGFFNEFGGYTIGRVWQDHDKPDPGAAKFPNGTVICKVLFVDIPTEQVPSLVDPVLWQGYITDTFDSNNRSVRTLALIQMDVAVRDERAPRKWLFGTFQYNGAQQSVNRWHNLVPVGLQWGDDPTITTDASNPEPVKTVINRDLKETAINDGPELPPTHLGWNGRLNGPVDNPRSSCMSCHATAEVPARSPLTPFFQPNPPKPGSEAWMRWFRNTPCGQPFDTDAQSTDFSLQLAMGIQNFYSWRDDQGGIYASEYRAAAPAAAAVQADFVAPRKTPEKKTIYKIQRNFADK
jgi:hypothetical protein